MDILKLYVSLIIELLCVGSCQTINPDSMSTAVISPIELLNITLLSRIINENFEFEIVKESSVCKFQHSEPSLILKHLRVFL